MLAPTALAQNPGDQIDLRYWKLTLPTDKNKDGKVDEVSVGGLKNYSHPDSFYVDEHGWVVCSDPKNKFALKAHRCGKDFADIGGQLEATLRVLHVAKEARYSDKQPAYSVRVFRRYAVF